MDIPLPRPPANPRCARCGAPAGNAFWSHLGTPAAEPLCFGCAWLAAVLWQLQRAKGGAA